MASLLEARCRQSLRAEAICHGQTGGVRWSRVPQITSEGQLIADSSGWPSARAMIASCRLR